MENHEKFSKKLSRLKEYNAITQPAKDGYHISVVRTKDVIPVDTLLLLEEVSTLKDFIQDEHNDSDCRVLNYKYTFHIQE